VIELCILMMESKIVYLDDGTIAAAILTSLSDV